MTASKANLHAGDRFLVPQPKPKNDMRPDLGREGGQGQARLADRGLSLSGEAALRPLPITSGGSARLPPGAATMRDGTGPGLDEAPFPTLGLI